ncbi:hypothetical protein SDC9_144672 [bioreactor metagenome]|uniref:Uncharacterized protein n=1 Tax=bioreactor metagenome TaxID=1076179 RepID=A0A645E7U6_9ZZZZ
MAAYGLLRVGDAGRRQNQNRLVPADKAVYFGDMQEGAVSFWHLGVHLRDDKLRVFCRPIGVVHRHSQAAQSVFVRRGYGDQGHVNRQLRFEKPGHLKEKAGSEVGQPLFDGLPA